MKLDRRHDRRDLPPDELAKLLGATRDRSTKFRDLDGIDRFHLYLTACGTGFRAAELAALTSASFDLDEAMATLAAEFTKNRKPAVQPLPADLVEALRDYLNGKPDDLPIYPSGLEHGPTDLPI